MKPTKNTAEHAPAMAGIGRRALEKRATILDAAEAIFVERGYHGTSLRDVSSAAGVTLALVSYHFGSKEGLFRAVIERRAPINSAGLRHSLQSALALKTRKSKLEAILLAFIAPVVDRSMRGGPGWKNYIRLMAQIANLSQRETFVSAVPEYYEGVVRAFIHSIKSLYPRMNDADLQWSFYFYQAAITHILAESGVIDRQTDGAYHSSDLDAIVPKLVRFCAAGFRALAKPAVR
jgi:AcrR family transcriptional regulator